MAARAFPRVCTILFALLVSSGLAATAADRGQEIAIIPLPARMEMASGSFTVERDTKLLVADHPQALAVAHYFGDLLFRTRGLRPEIVQPAGAKLPKKVIQFTLQTSGAGTNPEGYQLEISSQGIELSARDARGLFYGATTLWQILTTDTAAATSIRVPALNIVDAPRLRWRGLLLDSATNLQSVEFVRQFIDTMALHKLNVLHWRLVDDQAWRLEIKKYPKLTGTPRLNRGSYTQQQIREIVAYAAERNITIVPGIEMPAQAGAAVAAYPNLGAGVVSTARATLYNADETTFDFLADVLQEVAELFPGEYIHIGSAEFSKDPWKTSARVQTRMRELGIVNEQRLQTWYVQRIATIAHSRGRKLIGWDQPSNTGDTASTVAMSSRGLDGALAAAASGYDVVVSSFDTLNFNHRQGSAPDEPAGSQRLLTLQEVYAFDPAPVALGSEDLRHLVGMQANIWTDHVRTEIDASRITLPRAAAVAEVAWSPPAALRWPDFVARLAPQMKRYARLNIAYSDAAFQINISPRAVRGDRVAVELSRQISAGDIRYTLNGSEPTAKSSIYVDVLEVDSSTTIKAASFLNAEPLSSTTTAAVSAAIPAAQATN